MSRILWAVAAACLLPAPGSAQDGPGYVHLDELQEVSLARSAAPDDISQNAEIWILRNGLYVKFIEGTSDNACFVARTYVESMEPVCYDPEAARTILPIEIRRIELRIKGHSAEEVATIVNGEIGSGALPLPQRAAMSYMMSSRQRLISPDGRDVGNWHPHIMLYSPYLTYEEFGLTGDTPDISITNEGEPLAYFVVTMPNFVEPKPATLPEGG